MGFLNSITGWVYLQNQAQTIDYELFVEDFTYNPEWGVKIQHNAGGINFNTPVGIQYLGPILKGLWITDRIDFEGFMANIKTWQSPNQFFYFGFYRDAAKNFLKLDGTNEKYKVKIPEGGFKGVKPFNKGTKKYFRIALMRLEEAA